MIDPRAAFIPSPPTNGFHLGPFFVHAYGLAYVVALLAAVAIVVRRWEAMGGRRELAYEVALWAFPAGIVGGRLYFIATSWNEVPPEWWGPLAVWKGGLGIWGGVAAGTLAGLWVLRRRGADVPAFMDAAAPALLVAQAIGRVGNYFNQELFGAQTTLPWGLEISPLHRPAGYARYATFHPTFLYELIWDLLLAGALVRLGRRRSIRPPGLFALYVAGYSFARVGEELLRIDPAHHILGLRVNLFVASILCVAGVAWFVRIQRGRLGLPAKAMRRGGALLAAGGVLALTGCGQGSHAAAFAEVRERMKGLDPRPSAWQLSGECRFADLRHTFGTLAAQGFDLVNVQAMMGHADSRTTARYLHARPAAEDAAKLTKIFAKDTPSAIVDEPASVA